MPHYRQRPKKKPIENDTHTFNEHIGQKVRLFRLKRGWTLDDLAKNLDISHTQISKYEKGQTKISVNLLYQMAQLFSIPVENFFHGYVEKTEKDDNTILSNIISTEPKETINVLLVEDSPSDAVLLRTALSDVSFTINFHCLNDGAHVMDFLRRQRLLENFPRPNIIFLDLNLPTLGGLKVLRDIKQDRNLQDIPVIILTSNLDRQDMEMAYKNYASGYMVKSFDYKKFRATIHNTLAYWGQSVVLPS
jgi:CheY-like chemotaxis protein/DNA-binding XRE family transcriptional regulator